MISLPLAASWSAPPSCADGENAAASELTTIDRGALVPARAFGTAGDGTPAADAMPSTRACQPGLRPPLAAIAPPAQRLPPTNLSANARAGRFFFVLTD